jgi:S-adenosylmethionine:tRNA ribosyltransferase-isomerase
MVLNETKVFPARLLGQGPGGGKIEVLLLRRAEGDVWEALGRPGRRLRKGAQVRFNDGMLTGEVMEILPDGRYAVQLRGDDVEGAIHRIGRVPLPPYLRREDTAEDRERYQTVYARTPGAVAAPTAGLHFTTDLLDRIRGRGVDVAPVLLHVGPGTFRPVTAEDPRQHRMEAEYYEIGSDAAARIASAREEGGRVIAVGTTTVRALETAAAEGGGRVRESSGWTEIFICPPYTFRAVDVLITNFHLPRSTLLMLVSAFAGREFVLQAYREAVACGYRFYSYGDAMLIL